MEAFWFFRVARIVANEDGSWSLGFKASCTATNGSKEAGTVEADATEDICKRSVSWPRRIYYILFMMIEGLICRGAYIDLARSTSS